MGAGLGATVAAGAISGVASGQAGKATENVLEGRDVGSGLLNPDEMGRDALLGASGAALGYGASKAVGVVANEISTLREEAFLKDVATRAETWGSQRGMANGIGGSAKHAYAQEMIDKYQGTFGKFGRGFDTEVSYINGSCYLSIAKTLLLLIYQKKQAEAHYARPYYHLLLFL